MENFLDLRGQNIQKGILLDTKPFLLFLVGGLNPEFIATSKITKDFTKEDYELLIEFIEPFKRIVTTPNVLTEICSFLKKTVGTTRDSLYELLTNLIQELIEEYTPSKKVAENRHLPVFGLADLSILEIAKGRYLVLSDDPRLVDYLGRSGVDAINFNWLRSLMWL